MSDDLDLSNNNGNDKGENNKPNNVIDLSEARKEKSEGGEQDGNKYPKLPASQVQGYLVDLLKNGQLPRHLTGYDHVRLDKKFTVYRDEFGGYILFEIHPNNLVSLRTISQVADALYDVVKNLRFGPAARFNVTHRNCMLITDAWKGNCVALHEMPIPIRFQGQDVLAFNELPFPEIDPSSFRLEEKCLLLFKSLERMTNSKAFCMRIGSIFDPETNRKQAVWLSGEGDGGKSFWLDFVSFISGGDHGTVTISENSFKDAHFKQALIGKRVCFARDVTDRILFSPSFKELTGDDTHLINPKFMPAYTAKIHCLFFMASNDHPMIPNDSGLLNRIIHCEVQTIPPEERLDKHILWEKVLEEAPYFVAYCRDLYAAMGKKTVPFDQTSLRNSIDAYNSEFDGIFDANFIEDPAAWMKNTEFTMAIMQYLGDPHGRKYREFKKYLISNRNVSWDKIRFMGENFKIVRGIKAKNNFRQSF